MMDQFPIQTFGKTLLIVGGIFVVLGLFFVFGGKIPFIGRLPGDIHFQGQGFSFHFPLVTCLILSVVLTIILNLFFRK